jgi:hypothetical protein
MGKMPSRKATRVVWGVIDANRSRLFIRIPPCGRGKLSGTILW